MKCISQLIPNTSPPLCRLFLVAKNMPDYRIITVQNLSRHYFYNTSNMYNFKLSVLIGTSATDYTLRAIFIAQSHW